MPLLRPTDMVRSSRAPRRRRAPVAPPPPAPKAASAAAKAAPPAPPRRQHAPTSSPPPCHQGPLTRRAWPEAARRSFPRLYDSAWHASLYGFLLDLWAEAGAAHQRGDEAALRRAYAFANAALGLGSSSSSSKNTTTTTTATTDHYCRVSALLSLADALGDSDALLAGVWPWLADARLGRAALVPAVRELRGLVAAEEAAGAMLRAEKRKVEGREQEEEEEEEGAEAAAAAAAAALAPLPHKLAQVLARLRALAPLYPGIGVGALTTVAPAHGFLMD
jgi:hypothetical protein